MDLDAIFKVLNNADTVAAEESPYKPLTDFSSQFGNLLLRESPNYGVGENALASFITGLIGGGTQNLTNNYRADQSQLAQGVLSDAVSGRTLTRPEGLNPNVFSSMNNLGSAFKFVKDAEIADEKRKSELATQDAINRAKALSPIEIDTEVGKEKGRLSAIRDLYGSGGQGGIMGLPPGLQDNALQQQQLSEQNSKIDAFIDHQFETAKKLPSIQAAIPSTTAANEMAGIGITLTTALQAALGREMNAKEQEKLATATPDWNDSPAQIELKKQRFKELMQTISKSTPLADAIGGGGRTNAAPSEEMVTIRNKRTGETMQVPKSQIGG